MKNIYFLLVFGLLSIPVFQTKAQNLENLDDLSKRKLIALRGSFSLTGNYHISSRPYQQRNPFRYVLSGNPILSIYGFDLPISFTFANEDFSITGPDNFQRLGASPYYKWIKLHAGYRNVSFSPYTLDNHVFLGGGIELNPGKWRLGFVYGRFANAIAEDTLTAQVLPPSYKRTGYALKIGYGTPDNYIDISVLDVRDDPNSIPDPVKSGISPAKNLAFGISARQTLSRQLSFEINAGASAYTEDLTVAEVQSGEGRVPSFISAIYQPYASTRLNYAGDASLTFRKPLYSVQARYRYVDPGYETMGSYYFDNDLERLTLASSFSLWQGKMNVSGTVGLERNNLLDQKAATTRRTIGSANLQIAPFQRFALNVQYGNYSLRQQSGLIRMNDTTRIYQVNHTLNFTPTYFINTHSLYHNFVLALGKQTLVDKNIFTENFTESQTKNANFNYRLRSNLFDYGINAGVNYLVLTTYQTEITRYGASAGVEKGLLDGKLNLGLNGLYNISRMGERDDGYIMSGIFNVRYDPHPSHSFSLRSRAVLNRTQSEYEDYMFTVNYTFIL